jgi:hypothetical protein
MTLKLALILSAVWTLLIVVVAAVILWYVTTHPVAGASSDQRAAMIGSGLGVVACIGYAVLWMPLAAKVGARRRAERERKRKGKSRKRPRE